MHGNTTTVASDDFDASAVVASWREQIERELRTAARNAIARAGWLGSRRKG